VVNKKIKLCGINDLKVFKFCIEYPYSPDFLGFVFYDRSPRNINFKQAKEFADLIPGHIKKIAVVVNPAISDIEEIVESLKPDYIQLHGDEEPGFIEKLKELFNIKIIKAISVKETKDLAKVYLYTDVVDYFLFDTKSPEYGGSGKSFNWNILDDLKLEKDCFLSGGLNIDNLPDAIAKASANYFDLSSGIELQKGVKDTTKIAEILDYFKAINEKTDSR